MKHFIIPTVAVCLEIAAFSGFYRRTTEIVVRALLKGLSQISAPAACSLAPDLIDLPLNAGAHNLTGRWLT